MMEPKKTGESQPSPAVSPKQEREYCSEDLFQGAKTIVIHHDNETYRLIVTRNNKLILNK